MATMSTGRITGKRMVDVTAGRRIIGVAITVRVRLDHAVAFVTAPDPRGDGRAPRAMGAFRVDLATSEVLGLPRAQLVDLVCRRLATGAADWARAEAGQAPAPPEGVTGAAGIPGQTMMDFEGGPD